MEPDNLYSLAAKQLAEDIDKEVLKAIEFVYAIPYDQLPVHLNHESFTVRQLIKLRLESGI